MLIEITDNGTGIKKSLLDQIFNDAEIFLDDRQQRSQMGLKLTKTIIEQHGGKLSFRSELNRGTRVQIKLPMLTEKSRSLSTNFSG